jgi:hypothetical protein
MHFSLLSLSALLGVVAAADQTVLTAFVPITSATSLVGSVVTANAQTTAIALGCGTGKKRADCDADLTLTQISSTSWVYSTESGSATIALTCVATPTNKKASCKAVDEGAKADNTMTFKIPATAGAQNAEQFFAPVTVTAGQDKLAAATGTPDDKDGAGSKLAPGLMAVLGGAVAVGML